MDILIITMYDVLIYIFANNLIFLFVMKSFFKCELVTLMAFQIKALSKFLKLQSQSLHSINFSNVCLKR